MAPRLFQYQAIADPPLAPLTPPAVPLSWESKYADFAGRRTPALLTAAMAFCFYAVGAVMPDVAPPALAWAPTYSDFARPAQRLTTANQQSLGLTFALPQLPIPELAWEPEYADFAARQAPSLLRARRGVVRELPFE